LSITGVAFLSAVEEQDVKIVSNRNIVDVIEFFICINFCRCTISHNGLALGAVADFGAQNCQLTTKVDAR
jgi:hypothetical protein